MQDKDRNPCRIAALFDINAVAMPNIQHSLVERLDRRIKKFDCAFWA